MSDILHVPVLATEVSAAYKSYSTNHAKIKPYFRDVNMLLSGPAKNQYLDRAHFYSQLDSLARRKKKKESIVANLMRSKPIPRADGSMASPDDEPVPVIIPEEAKELRPILEFLARITKSKSVTIAALKGKTRSPR